MFKTEYNALMTELDQKYETAFRCWARYYRTAEAYDRTLPGRMLEGEWMPHPEHRGASSRHAHDVYRATLDELDRHGVDANTSNLARSSAMDLNYEKLCEVPLLEEE